MAQRFSAWFNANAYPWESYDESRERYEQQFGPIKEKSKVKAPEGSGNRITRWKEKDANRGKPTEQKVEETSGFLDSLKDFNNMMPWDDTFQGLAAGAVVGVDDAQASVGLFAGDTIAPTLEDLGLNSLGETVREWGYDTYRTNKAEAAEEEKKYARPKSVEEELREADPNYRARTKTEIREADDSVEASILKTFPSIEKADWIPSSEEFARDLPTSYDVGRTLTASGIPMVAAAGTAAAGIATGNPLLGAIGAMGVGSLGGAALVSTEYSEQVRTNPVVRRSLGIDPDKPFAQLTPANQQKLLRVASDAGRLTFGRRLTSSGIPEMLSYSPYGGRIFRAFLDVAGGTTSEILDIDVGEKAIVDALIRNGVPQDRALALQQSLREIGPEKSKVFTQTLVTEGIISGGFTSLEDAAYGAASEHVDENATSAKRQKEEQKKFEEDLQKLRRKAASDTDKIIQNAGVTVEHIEDMMEANDVEGATALFEHVKKAEPRMQNDVAELLMQKNPTALWRMGKHLGDVEIMDKAEEANQKLIDDATKDQDKVEADQKAVDQKEEERKQKARDKRREDRLKREEKEAADKAAAAVKAAEDAKKKGKKKVPKVVVKPKTKVTTKAKPTTKERGKPPNFDRHRKSDDDLSVALGVEPKSDAEITEQAWAAWDDPSKASKQEQEERIAAGEWKPEGKDVKTPKKKVKTEAPKKKLEGVNAAIDKAVKAFKKKNPKATLAEVDAVSMDATNKFLEKTPPKINKERDAFVALEVQKAEQARAEVGELADGTTPPKLNANEINKIEAKAIKAWDKKSAKKSGVTSRSASTRSPKRGAFGLAVNEVKSLVTSFVGRNKKLKKLGIKYHVISKNNKKDVQGLRNIEEAYFDSQDGKGEFAPEKKEAWVNGRVEDTLKNTEGFIDDKTGEITIVTENITGDSATVASDRLVEVIFHETVGHHGLKKTLGDGLQLFLSRFRKTEAQRVRKYFTEGQGMTYLTQELKGVKEVKDRQKIWDGLSDKTKNELTEEFIVRKFAEFGARDPDVINRMGVHIQRALNKQGWGKVGKNQVMMTLAEIQKEYIGGERNFWTGETFKPVGFRAGYLETGEEAEIEKVGLTAEEEYKANERMLREGKKKKAKVSTEPRPVERAPDAMEEEYGIRNKLYDQTLEGQVATHNESQDFTSLHTYVLDRLKSNRKVRGNKEKKPLMKNVAQGVANRIQDSLPDRNKWKKGKAFEAVFKKAVDEETKANTKPVKAPKPMTATDVKKSIKLYHGSPKRFNKFVTDHVDVGAHGWGLYFSDFKAIAEIYSRPKGYLYGVDLTPKREEFMDLDKSYDDQSEYVKTILKNILINEEGKFSPSQLNWQTGDHVYNWAQYHKGGQKGASEYLSNRGIKGQRTAPSKFTHLGSKIYVVYKADDILIKEVTDETKALSGIKQSRKMGLYAKYNKEYKAEGTMLLHNNTKPDEGPYRITFFSADGELDTDRTEMGHEHFPTLAKAKSRLKEVGDEIQDISGGRSVKMSKKITQPTRDIDSTLDMVQDRGMRANEISNEDLELELRWLREQEAKGRTLPISKEHEAAIRDVGLKYSRRTKPPPKKTFKAYKLFRMKKSKPGQLFPLFIGRANPVIMGEWLDAEFIPTKGFSPRPGWHLSDTPAALHIGTERKPVDGKQKPTIRRDDEVWAEVEVADDVDWQPEADSRGRVYSKGHKLAGQPMPSSREIKDEIPVDGNYRYKTNPNMTGEWVIAGAVKVNRILTDGEIATLNKKAGIIDLPRKRPLDTKVYGFKQSRKVGTFTEELAQAEAKIDPVAVARASAGRVEEGKKVKDRRKTMVDRLTLSREYLEKKSDEGHGTPLGYIKMSRKHYLENVPEKILKEMEGKTAVGGVSDRLIRGKYKPTRKDSVHANDIFLGGGPGYAFDKELNKSAVWASTKGAITKVYNAVLGIKDGKKTSEGAEYGYIILGKDHMHMSNMDVWAVANGEALDAVELGGASMDALDTLAQEAVDRYVKTRKDEITTFKQLMAIGNELTFGQRKNILSNMFNETKSKKHGLVSFEQIMRGTSAYPDAKLGDLVGVLKFHKDKTDFRTSAKELGIDEHPSYSDILQGEGVVMFKTPIPLETYGREFLTGPRSRQRMPFWTEDQTKFTDEDLMYTSEMVSFLNKTPVESGPLKGQIITKRPPKDRMYKKRSALSGTADAVLSIERQAAKMIIRPEMLIKPQKIDSNAKKMSRKLVKKSADFSHSRMGDPAIFEWQDKLAHKLTRRLVSQGTLNDVEMYKELRRRNKGTILLAEQAGERLFKVLSKSEDQKALYDYFTTFNADPTTIKNETERKEAVAAKKKINDIGKALVKRGLMTQESLEKFGDQYLPRKYMKYLLSESDYAKISTGGADVKLDLSYLKKRLDIPQGIRELILGEVKDPAFLSSVAITAPLRDMAMLDWLEQIAIVGTKEGRDWVLPETLVQFDTLGMMRKLAGNDTELIKQLQLYDTEGVNVSGHWLLNEAERLQDLIDNRLVLTPDKEALVKGLIKKMKASGQKIAGVVLPKNYVKVPKGRKYGMLSGMAVRKEIFQDIWGSPSQGSFDVDDTGHISQSWAEKVLGTGGAFERYNRLWKWSKVSANPPSWVRNFISNMIFMTLGPIPIHSLPKLFTAAIADQLKARNRQRKGEAPDPKSMTVLADKMGLTSGGFSQVELKMIRNSFAESQVKGDGVLGILNVRNAFMGFEKYVQRPTSDLYGGIDTLGKVMMLTHLKKKGYSDDRAAMEAEKWLFDYSNPLPSVKYLRKSAFGAPFLSYPSFVAPLMIETIIKRPWKLAPYFIFGELMTALFKEQQDIDDEEWQASLETLPTYLKNKAVGGAVTDKLFPKSVIPLWWPASWGGSLDKLGRAQPIDIGYLQPWGMFAEVMRELDPTKKGGWSPADATHSIGLLGAPILNIATTMLTNRDPFSDREIFDEFATQGEKAAAWFHYMFNLTMPPMMHGWTAGPGQGFGAIRRLIDAFDDTVVTREGEPKFTEGQAIARMFGMNVTPLAPHEARQKNAYFEMQKIQRLQRKIVHDYKSGVFQGLSKKELKEVVKKNVDKLNTLVKDLKETLAKPLPASLKRSSLQKLKAREKFLKRVKTLKAG